MSRLSSGDRSALLPGARLVSQGQPARQPARSPHLLTVAASLAAAAWFTVPVFQGTYTEGFEPTIGINADALRTGRTADVDLLYPFNGRFFLVTRLGCTAVIAALNALDGLPTLLNFRAVMLASLLLLVGSVAFILARIYRVHPAFGVLACLLFPPVFETAYFFNDNVLSAGLSTLALGLFWTRLSLPATASAAVLMGFAAATRPDALFILPAFAVLMWFDLPSWRARFLHALVAAPVIALVPLATYAAFGLSYFEIFAIAPRAIALWNRPEGFLLYLRHAVNGLSLPAMVALPLGIASLLLRRRWREVCLCVLVPLIYFAAYGRALYELRYLLPLTPFVAIAVAEGGRAALRSRGVLGLTLRGALVLAFAISFAPPVPIPSWRVSQLVSKLGTDLDGPRPLIGRFWSPLVWLSWLGPLNAATAALAGAVEQAAHGSGTTLFVSAHWNPDRLLDLLLLEHGFQPQQERMPEACRTMGEMFTRGDAAVLHVRTHIPFIRDHREAVTWERGGLPCVRAAGLEGGTALVLGWRPANYDPPVRPGEATDIYRPARQLVPGWADPAFRRSVYMITRVAVPVVGNFLNQALTPEERRVADVLFDARTRLLQ